MPTSISPTGTFATATANGLGNLIIGYNELPNPNIAQPGERGGSHNLVMGRWNKFFDTSFSSFIGGQWNVVRGFESAVISGYHNNLNGVHSVIVGGSQNGEGGGESVIVGGYFNGDGGSRNVVLGGITNQLAGNYSVLLGGRDQRGNGDNQIFPQIALAPAP